MFTPLNAIPGINKEITQLENANGYSDGNNVRFWQGKPRLIGGAVDTSAGNTFTGICRGMHTWQDHKSNINVAIGTTSEFDIWQGGIFNDITPFRVTTTPNNPFTTQVNSNIVTVTDPVHGAATGDNIFITGSSGVSNVAIGGKYLITVVDPDTYTITISSVAITASTGGGTPNLNYYIGTGSANGSTDIGWGAGPYGFGTWGTPRTTANDITSVDPRTWSMDNFGQDLIFTPKTGGVYYWSATSGISKRAITLRDYIASISPPGTILDTKIPVIAESLLVAMPNQQVCVYGTDDGTGVQDKMFMRFSSEGDITTWTASFNNTAGSFRLQGGQRIMNALHCGSEILILTDTDAIAQRFVGGSDVFGFFNIATNCGLISSKAVVEFNGVAFWMGVDNFFFYTGVVQAMPCTLRTFVLNTMNFSQRGKFHAGINRQYGEVWFFYVSSASSEIDSFVAFEVDTLYSQNPIWWKGSVARTAWDAGQAFPHPVSVDTAGRMYFQERGRVDENGNRIVGFLETGYRTLGEGDHQMFADTYIPDLITQDGNDDLGVTFKFKRYQNSSEIQTRGPFAIKNTTEKIKVRGRGRRMSLRYDMSGNVQLGQGIINLQPDGKR